jgi:hypothetical protein
MIKESKLGNVPLYGWSESLLLFSWWGRRLSEFAVNRLVLIAANGLQPFCKREPIASVRVYAVFEVK